VENPYEQLHLNTKTEQFSKKKSSDLCTGIYEYIKFWKSLNCTYCTSVNYNILLYCVPNNYSSRLINVLYYTGCILFNKGLILTLWLMVNYTDIIYSKTPLGFWVSKSATSCVQYHHTIFLWDVFKSDYNFFRMLQSISHSLHTQ